MPVEIKEIIIRATVGDAGASAPQASAPAGGGMAPGTDVLQECIEQVFQIISDKKER